MDFENCGTKAILATRDELEFPMPKPEEYQSLLHGVRERAKSGVDAFIDGITKTLSVHCALEDENHKNPIDKKLQQG